MFWVAMNEHQAWMEDHVTVMVAMGPVAHVEHVKGPIRLLAPFATEFEVRNMVSIKFHLERRSDRIIQFPFSVSLQPPGCERVRPVQRPHPDV